MELSKLEKNPYIVVVKEIVGTLKCATKIRALQRAKKNKTWKIFQNQIDNLFQLGKCGYSKANQKRKTIHKQPFVITHIATIFGT